MARRPKQITVTLPDDLHALVVEAAQREDIPLTFWVRAAMRAKLNQGPES
jgi:predicted HicB family RNase H-like nuclease